MTKPFLTDIGDNCKRCGVDVVKLKELAYMVHSSIWTVAVGRMCENRRILLCIGCLEDLIGYTLNVNHFLPAPINIVGAASNSHSDRLKNRLGKFNQIYGAAAIEASVNTLTASGRLTKEKALSWLEEYTKAL